MPEESSILGKRLPRKDGLEKVKGEAEFVTDMQLPGMLYAAYLRSPHAHAFITKINTSKAEASPGVRAVLTHKNTPKVHPRGKLGYLLNEKAYSAGDEVAAVAAISKEIAGEALKLIDIEYDVLPPVFDAEEAMKPDAPLLFPDYGTNMFHGSNTQPVPRCQSDGWLPLEVGDVEKGFAEADYILEDSYETPMQYPCSPMPRAVICQWSGDKLTCWIDTQVASRVWLDMAKTLNMPQSNIRIISTYPVGGFGGKEPDKTGFLTALLAKKAGKPVKSVFTREEDFIATHRRLNYKGQGKIGIKKDGTITALQQRMITNYGKDSVSSMLILASSGVGTCSMLYPCPNSKWEGCSVISNTPCHGPVNGFGDPEAGFCLERLIDEAAEKIDMDPVTFRLKNCMRYGTRGLGAREAMGLAEAGGIGTLELEWGVVGTDMDSLPECIIQAVESAGWKDKWKGWKTPVEINGSKRKGIGIALGMHHSAFHLSGAAVKINQDGTANILSSFVDMGSGFGTALSQVVAETLGMNYEDVTVLLADTMVTPLGHGNTGEAGTSSGIAAAKIAADDARCQLLGIAAEKLDVNADQLEAANRRIYIKNSPEKGISIAEACLAGYQITGVGINPPLDTIIDKKSGKGINPYAAAATIIEVEVDTETGELEVLTIASAHDCGRVINPTMVENQINCASTMGNGWVRSERYVIDRKTGVIMNPNLLDYKILTFLDMPHSDGIREIFVERPCAWGPFGAKGMSETPITTPAPALANAIYNAIGVRITGEHLTPDRILEALGK